MIDQETMAYLNSINADISPAGSRVTCSPPPADTDADFLVLILPHDVAGCMARLSMMIWIWEGSREHYQNQAQDSFMPFRKGSVNLLVSANAEWGRRHKAATFVCTRLNLMNKDDRVTLFQAVLYGECWSRK